MRACQPMFNDALLLSEHRSCEGVSTAPAWQWPPMSSQSGHCAFSLEPRQRCAEQHLSGLLAA